jgi:Na+-translocating ferredoxin:NAD+ oxidoreductase RnfA subunit
MNSVLSAVATFFFYAVIAVFAQNAVFTRGMGVSRLIQLVGDDDTSSLLFASLLCVICVLNAPFAWLINRALEQLPWRVQLRPLGYVLCIAIVCGLLWLALTYLKLPWREQLRGMLPNAAFNTCVAGTLLVTTTQSYTLPQSLGFGLGSGAGYFLAVLLVAEARRRLQGSEVPKAFRGLPIVLLYIGILALAVYGFTGHAVVI